MVVRTAGICDQFENQETGRQGSRVQIQGALPGESARRRRGRDERRRLAIPPDEGHIRGRRPRLQQPVGHRLRRQRTAPHQRVCDPALVARHPGRHLPAPGGPAFQSVHLQRHRDDCRSPPSVGARRRSHLSVRCLPAFAARADLHGQHPRARGALGRAGAERLRLRCASRRRLPDGQQRAVDRLQPGDWPGGRLVRARLARRRHLRTGSAAEGDGTDLQNHPEEVRGRGVAGPLFRPGEDDRRRARRSAAEPQRLACPAGQGHPAEPRREAHAEARDTRPAAPTVRQRRQLRTGACAQCGPCT